MNTDTLGSPSLATSSATDTIALESLAGQALPASIAALLGKLNPEQRLAAEHGLSDTPSSEALAESPASHSSPLLVIAGAGTGKTATLAHRVANLISHGVQPQRILLLTFSRRAAVEMGRRVERIAARAGLHGAMPGGVLPWSGTFHAVGARLLREYAPFIGLSPSFSISDRDDAADLMNLVRHERGLSAKQKRFPTKHTCLSIYSRVVNTTRPINEVLAGSFPWCAEWETELRDLFAAYVEAKQAQDVLDYDDLLLYWAQMSEDSTIAADLGQRFEHVLVDEYQDTNRLQACVLQRIKPSGQGVTVVGDDAQSIYAFRGATVRNILDFPHAFPEPARIIKLERNYRSVQPILQASNAIIGLAPEGFAKHLWTDKESVHLPVLVSVTDEIEQARYVASRILERRETGMTLKSQAVLFRASHHSAPLEIELTRRNIPFVKFGGLKFLDARHVKDLLAVLRWLENPRDRVAGFRVLQLLPGVGPATAAAILHTVDGELSRLAPPARAVDGWAEFAAMVHDVGIVRASWPSDFSRIRTWYEPHLERLHEDAAQRAADLDQLENIAATFPTRERFLTELTLDPPDAVSDESGIPLKDEDYLILSTIHSAKGQEWDAVYVLNMVDGCMPSDLATGSPEEIEEERRLLYVATTRAKAHLDLILPQRFYVHQQAVGGDRHVYASRTRFIPPRLLPMFESVTWPRPAAATAHGSQALAAVKIDIAAKMRGMWQR